jgi:hypothetical protein
VARLRSGAEEVDAGGQCRVASGAPNRPEVVASPLMIVFVSRDPHLPAPARFQVLSALDAAGIDGVELHVYEGASTRSCGTWAHGTTPCPPTSR